MTTINRTRRFS
jgi:hypothetical protein